MDQIILQKLLAMVSTLVFIITGLIAEVDNLQQQSPTTKLGASLEVPTSVALFSTTLSSAITNTATTMTLTSATYNGGASTLASSTYAFVLDEGSSNQELVLADCTGTACTNMTRGLDRLTGTTTVSALRFAHRRGASVKITDGPQLMILSRIINGIATVPNKLSYTSTPTLTGANDLVYKSYVDGGVLAGAATSTESTTGISRLATKLQQASSTLSTANTPLVLQAQNATSTYNAGAAGGSGLNVVVTQNDNRIDNNFLSTTTAITWASSTINNLNVNNLTATGTINIAGSGQAASSTKLTSNGAGGLSFLPESWGLLTRATNAGAVATATASFSPRSRLKIIFSANGLTSAANGNSMAFNASSTNYSYVRMLDGVVVNQARNTQISNEWGANSTTSPFSIVFEINNATSSVKQATYTGSYASPTGLPMFTSGVVVWGGLDAQINSVSFNADRWGDAQTNTFLAGSTIEVYGSDTR